jgi:hypothetical protein
MFRKIMLILVAMLLLVCLGGTAVSLITNRNLPTEAMDDAQLSALDKARLAEIFHLRQTLGNEAWPGWGDAAIPVIVYNDAYAFLVGYDDPPPGWIKVPQQEQRGNAWQPVPDDDFQGQPYYRTLLPDNGQTPQAFTVLVGDQWAASLQTRPAMRVIMARQFRDMLPGGVSELLPYALATNLFLRNSDSYIAAVLHESFHAYQGAVVPERLMAAEWIGIENEADYPTEDEAFAADWQAELDLLVAAIRAEDEGETAVLTQQFLDNRAARRAAANLSDALVDYERLREWEEGLALYNELNILRLAYNHDDYQPVAAMAADPEFDDYQKFEQRWQQEVAQIARMASNEGGGRFYYSGMAQATLLDRLMPGWKTQIFDEGVFLEDLLAAALAN